MNIQCTLCKKSFNRDLRLLKWKKVFCNRKCYTKYRSRTMINFLNKVSKKKGFGPKGTCWRWLGSKTSQGYGMMQLKKFNGGGINRKPIPAHRISYLLFKGNIPKTKNKERICVLHKCDNTSCVNPQHLWLGTYKQNTWDSIKKDRWKLRSKLTEKQVKFIRRSKKSGVLLAKKFKVDPNSIYRIRLNQTWKHI